jgi:hypothetical protein
MKMIGMGGEGGGGGEGGVYISTKKVLKLKQIVSIRETLRGLYTGSRSAEVVPRRGGLPTQTSL